MKPKPCSIIDETQINDWEEVILGYSGGYTGGNTMLSAARGGAGNQSRPPILLTDISLCQQTLKDVVITLFANDPTKAMGTKQYSDCALSCAKIALMIAEPIRFEFFKRKMSHEWLVNGYKICSDGESLIRNWLNVSVLVQKNINTKEDEEILKTDNRKINQFLEKYGVKLGSQLKDVFGVVIGKEESHQAGAESRHNHSDATIPRRSKGKTKFQPTRVDSD